MRRKWRETLIDRGTGHGGLRVGFHVGFAPVGFRVGLRVGVGLHVVYDATFDQACTSRPTSAYATVASPTSPHALQTPSFIGDH